MVLHGEPPYETRKHKENINTLYISILHGLVAVVSVAFEWSKISLGSPCLGKHVLPKCFLAPIKAAAQNRYIISTSYVNTPLFAFNHLWIQHETHILSHTKSNVHPLEHRSRLPSIQYLWRSASTAHTDQNR